MYIEARKLARDVNEVLPSREEVSNLYRTVKSQLHFFKNFINRNLINRNQEGVSDPSPRNPTPPPTPPPDPMPDAMPDPMPEPMPEPIQTPPPVSTPTLATPINLETSMIGNLPYAVLGGGAMLAAGALSFRNRQNRIRSGEDPVLRQNTAVNRERTNIPIDREPTIEDFRQRRRWQEPTVDFREQRRRLVMENTSEDEDLSMSSSERRELLEQNQLQEFYDYENELINSELDLTEEPQTMSEYIDLTEEPRTMPEYNENIDPLFAN